MLSKTIFDCTIAAVGITENTFTNLDKKSVSTLVSLFNKSNVRFCLICNYISKLIPQLRDYLLLIPFYNTINNTKYIQNIIDNEKLVLKKGVLNDIIFNYYPDLRSVVNCLQVYQSFEYPLIRSDIINLNCKKYKDPDNQLSIKP